MLTFSRRCCSRATLLHCGSITSHRQKQNVRALRGPPRSCVHGIPRDDVLALQQLLDVLELSLRNACYLGYVVHGTSLFPQLDQPIPYGVVDW